MENTAIGSFLSKLVCVCEREMVSQNVYFIIYILREREVVDGMIFGILPFLWGGLIEWAGFTKCVFYNIY